MGVAHDDIAKRVERLRKLETLRLWRKQDVEKKKFMEAKIKQKELEVYNRKAIWWQKNKEYEETRMLRQTQIELLKAHNFTKEYKRYYSHINREHINNLDMVPREWVEWMEKQVLPGTEKWDSTEQERSAALIVWLKDAIKRTNFKHSNVTGCLQDTELPTPSKSDKDVAKENVSRYINHIIRKAILEFVSRIVLTKIAEIISRTEWVSFSEGASPASIDVTRCPLNSVECSSAPCGAERALFCKHIDYNIIGDNSLILRPTGELGYFWTVLLGSSRLPCDPSRLENLYPPCSPHITGLIPYLIWRGHLIVNYPLPKILKDLYNIKYVKSMLYDIECPVFAPIYTIWKNSGKIYITPDVIRKFLRWTDKKMKKKDDLNSEDIIKNIVINWVNPLIEKPCNDWDRLARHTHGNTDIVVSCPASEGGGIKSTVKHLVTPIEIQPQTFKPEHSLEITKQPNSHSSPTSADNSAVVSALSIAPTHNTHLSESRVRFLSKTYIEANPLKSLDIEAEELKSARDRLPTPHPSVTDVPDVSKTRINHSSHKQVVLSTEVHLVNPPLSSHDESGTPEEMTSISSDGRSIGGVIRSLTSDEKICTVCDLRVREELSSEVELRESAPLVFEKKEAPPVIQKDLFKKKNLIKRPLRAIMRKIYGWVMTTAVRRRLLATCNLPTTLVGERFYRPRFDPNTFDMVRGLSKLVLEHATSNYPFVVLEPYIDVILHMTMDASKRRNLTKRLIRLNYPLTEEQLDMFKTFYRNTEKLPFFKNIRTRKICQIARYLRNRDITKEFSFFVIAKAGEYVNLASWVIPLGIIHPDQYQGDYLEEVVRWSPWYIEPVPCQSQVIYTEEDQGEDYPLPDFEFQHKRPDYRDPRAGMTNKERVLDIAQNRLDLKAPPLRKITAEVREQFKFHNKEMIWQDHEALKEFHKRITLFDPVKRRAKRRLLPSFEI